MFMRHSVIPVLSILDRSARLADVPRGTSALNILLNQIVS